MPKLRHVHKLFPLLALALIAGLWAIHTGGGEAAHAAGLPGRGVDDRDPIV